jgi:hypothetical protein
MDESPLHTVTYPNDCSEIVNINTEIAIIQAESAFSQATKDAPVSTPEQKRIGIRWDYEAYRFIETVVLAFANECIKHAKRGIGSRKEVSGAPNSVADIRRMREEFLGTVTAYAYVTLIPSAERTNPETFDDFVFDNLRKANAWRAHLFEVANLVDVKRERTVSVEGGVKAPDEEVKVTLVGKHSEKGWGDIEYDQNWYDLECEDKIKRITAVTEFKNKVQADLGTERRPIDEQVAENAGVAIRSFQNWKQCNAGREVHEKIVATMTKKKWSKGRRRHTFTAEALILSIILS